MIRNVCPFYFLLLGFSLWIMGCDSAPKKTDVRQKVIGKYCNEDHSLILTDSNTYTNIKYLKGILTDVQYQESCSGKYQIDMKEGHWIIRFEKSPNPKSVSDCQQEYTLWTEKEGYLIGEKEVTMRDLFDNTPLTKSKCKE